MYTRQVQIPALPRVVLVCCAATAAGSEGCRVPSYCPPARCQSSLLLPQTVGTAGMAPYGVLPLMGTGGIFIATIIVMNQCLCQGLHLQLVVMITSINNSVMDILSYC